MPRCFVFRCFTGSLALAASVVATLPAPSAAATTAPVVTSISRLQPGPLATSSMVTWRVTFSESVTGVDASDFTLTPISGAAAGTISAVSGSGAVYTVTASSLSGVGTLRLDVNAGGTGIINSGSATLAGGFAFGQPYTHVRGSVVVAWGFNNLCQLGNNSFENGAVPVNVRAAGALSGKIVVAASAGCAHSLALTSDGLVYSWGRNDFGELGNGSTTLTGPEPVAVTTTGALAGKTVIAIAAGGAHNLALTADGKIFAWGDNMDGQLGNGSMANSSVPVAVTMSGALSGKTVVAIAAGNVHSMALTSDGQVYVWGNNGSRTLGIGDSDALPTYETTPVAVLTGALPGKTVVAIATGGWSSMALTNDGQIYAWGDNFYCQLGNHSIGLSSVPIAVTDSGILSGKTFVSIGAGFYHNLGLTSDGQIYAWGRNDYGQLGAGSTDYTQVPVAVTMAGALSGKVVAEIAAGFNHSEALTSDGQIFAWGCNSYNQLGNNLTATSAQPVAVDTAAADGSALAGRSVYTLSANSGDHSLALASPAQVTSISRRDPGPLSTTDTVTWRVTFSEGVTGVDVSDFALTSVTGSATGTISSVTGSGAKYTVTVSSLSGVGTLRLDVKAGGTGIIDSNGSLIASGFTCGQTYTHVRNTAPVAWGANYSGQLGNNSTPASPVPTSVLTTGALKNKTVVALAGGQSHSLALTSDGQIFAWGWNDSGTLGNNSNAASSVPVAVTSTGVLTGKLIVGIAGGQGHSLALARDGHVYAWGDNSHGQLGNNSMIGSLVPVEVTATGVLAGKTVIAVSAGRQHNLALTSDGQICAWGSNSRGELGNNSTIDSSMPVAVATTGTPLAGKAVIAISAGEQHSLALTSDGQVYAWGNNVDGRLGDGSRVDRPVPVAVTTAGVLSGKAVVAIAASADYSMVMTSDGQVFAWGWNTFGNLGNNSIVASSVPVAVTMSGVLSGKTVVAIAAAARNGQVLTSEGRIYAWGDNSYGELGNNSSTYSWVPVAVETDAAGGSALAGRSVYTLGTYSCSYHNLALASPMAASSVEEPASGRYWAGDALAFVVNFPQPVTVITTGGAPRLALTVGSTTRYTTYTSGTGTTALTFAYTVQASDAATTAIALTSTAIDLNGGALTDAASGVVDLTLPSPGVNGAFLAPPMAYAIWAAANFTAGEQGNPAISGPNADPDGAGMPNLLRYALGLPARGPNTAATTVALDPASNPSALTLTFPVRAVADGLIYEVQSSQDLVNWTTEETYEVSGSTRSQPCSVEVPIGAKRLFLRLHVVQN